MEADSLGEFRYDTLKVYYRKGTEDEKVLAHSFDNDIYFKEIPSFKPGKKPVIIDVGAHIGTFSLLAHLKYPESRVFALEASWNTFEILKRNVQFNQLPIKVFHNALLDRDETVRLYHNTLSGNWGHSITKKLSSSFEEVKAVSLENFVLENEIDFVDLIKLNCEGSEYSILLNTPEYIIKKIGAAIILYHQDLADLNYSINDLIALFRQNSFRVLVVYDDGKRGWLLVWNKSVYSNFYFAYSALFRRLKLK
jgi:FkbM family methyltransferase